MNPLSSELKELIQNAWKVRCSNFSPVIKLDNPRKTTTISTTGRVCSLDCAHCGGYYLKHMTPISKAMEHSKANGSKSCLVSGGCNPQGSIEFDSHMHDILYLKNSGLRLNIHTGLPDINKIDEITTLADVVSFDFITDDDTINEVFGNGRSGQEYIDAYISLKQRTRVIPHICIGLKGGVIKGEYAALEKLRQIGADALVFIVFIPTPGTRYADRKPPDISEVLTILATARIAFPHTPIHLGCMRPGGKVRAEIDYYSLECGVNSIVSPSKGTVEHARTLGLDAVYGEECCVFD